MPFGVVRQRVMSCEICHSHLSCCCLLDLSIGEVANVLWMAATMAEFVFPNTALQTDKAFVSIQLL